MKVHWMRRIVGDAGNLQRLYWAVDTASRYQADNLQSLCEIYIRKFGKLAAEGPRKRGLGKNSDWRSAEPHFSLAKEIDLLEWRERERWRISFGAGRAFEHLWRTDAPPVSLLVHQVLTYDRTFLVPFLVRLVEAEYDLSSGKYVGLESYAREAWEEVWNNHYRELQSIDPPLPDPVHVKQRTLLHHAAARVRFLNRLEGLGLGIEKLERLAHQFFEYQSSEDMPSDSFLRIGASIQGKRPSKIEGTQLTEVTMQALLAMQRASHASAYGVFLFANETALPDSAIEWDTFVNHVRREPPFSLRSSFRRDDFLITVQPQATMRSSK